MSRLGSFGSKLYRGEVGYDFVSKRKIWYGISILITITAIVGLAVRGLNMSIEFSGGAVFTTPKTSMSISAAQSTAEGAAHGHQATVQRLGDGGMRIQVSDLTTKQSDPVQDALAKKMDLPSSKINTQLVGPSWGKDISDKAWEGLGIFMVLVVLYLAIAFEWRMALAALIALIHDLTITTGIYALVGFEVSPGTVMGLLTILGYSLYDTVVVFDGLKEASKDITKQTRFTYEEIANRSLNSTLVRSINTTIAALLPVAALLFIGGGLLGAGMLNDISLALFVGLAAGAYSSIFIATPLVADLKGREPRMRALAQRVRAKRASAAAKAETEAERADRDGAGGAGAIGEEPADATPAGVVGPRGSGPGGGGGRRQPVSRNRGRGRPSGKRR